MKFPKEEIILINKVRNIILTDDCSNIIEIGKEVLEHASFLNKYSKNIIDAYIKKLFECREFESVISFVEDLIKINLEDCNWYYYALASLIANKDLYYAKRLITKSKLLNDKSISYLIDPENANYSAIFNLHYELLDTIGLCLILINFINELITESLNIKMEDEYLIMRFFDLLNLLFEYGLDENIIEQFEKTIKTIYEVPLD